MTIVSEFDTKLIDQFIMWKKSNEIIRYMNSVFELCCAFVNRICFNRMKYSCFLSRGKINGRDKRRVSRRIKRWFLSRSQEWSRLGFKEVVKSPFFFRAPEKGKPSIPFLLPVVQQDERDTGFLNLPPTLTSGQWHRGVRYKLEAC